MIITRRLALASLGALAVAPVLAQAPARLRIRGTVEKLEGAVLSIKTADGSAMVFLAENTAVAALEKGSPADIKAGLFIGAGALPQPDGTLKAVQVTIFPESLRGAGEGHRAWDVLPESTMTNANITEAIGGVDGATLTLAYKGGEKKLVLAPDTRILKLVAAGAGDVQPGAEVSLFAEKAADGSLKTARVTVSRGGAASM